MCESKEVVCCYCRKPASQAEIDFFKTTKKEYWTCSEECEKMKTFFDIFLDAIEELYKAQKQALTASFNSYAIDQKIEEIKLRKSFKNII